MSGWFVVALVGGAWAQIPGLPPGIDLSALGGNVTVGGPKAELRYVVGAAASVRFLGDSVAGPTFADGEMVELVTTEGDLVRIRKGDRYGWVPSASLSVDAPAAPPAPVAPGGANPLLGGTQPAIPVPIAPPAPAPAPVP